MSARGTRAMRRAGAPTAVPRTTSVGSIMTSNVGCGVASSHASCASSGAKAMGPINFPLCGPRRTASSPPPIDMFLARQAERAYEITAGGTLSQGTKGERRFAQFQQRAIIAAQMQ